MLHGEPPWYRASRDTREVGIPLEGKTAFSPSEVQTIQVPHRGGVFLGYSHMSGDPLSGGAASESGWNFSAEKKLLRYFGAVADFSGQSGSTAQRGFLFGLRGGASIRRVRPFAQVLFGAAQLRQSSYHPSKLTTSFAEALGVGIDSPVTHLLSWRVEADSLMTSFDGHLRQDLRLSTGPVLNF